MTATAIAAPFGLIGSLFDYNRKNYSNDNDQRQLFEFQVQDMKIEQARLWREDIRDVMNFTEHKMELYLIVTTLMLGFGIMALVKGRVSSIPDIRQQMMMMQVLTAIAFLLLSLWLGMYAYVTAQACKVRILTQNVRYPIPAWGTLEATRTYLSTFERTRMTQMFRTPFGMGRQEEYVQGVNLSNHMSESATHGSNQEGNRTIPDPWGLEHGLDTAELAPDVNTRTAWQHHIQLAREALKYYETYDAFARISLTYGASNFALWTCMFLLESDQQDPASRYILVCAMIIAITVATVLLKLECELTNLQLCVYSFFTYSAPLIVAIVDSTDVLARTPTSAYLLIVACVTQSGMVMMVAWVFGVKKTADGVMLPLGSRNVLYLDVFGWMKRTQTRHAKGFSHGKGTKTLDPAPTTKVEYSFRAGTFGGAQEDTETDAFSGADIKGEKPGTLPWHSFFILTVFVCCLWLIICGIGVYEQVTNTIQDTLLLTGVPIPLTLDPPLATLNKVACNSEGSIFALMGRNLNGALGVWKNIGGVTEEGLSMIEVINNFELGESGTGEMTLDDFNLFYYQPGGGSIASIPLEDNFTSSSFLFAESWLGLSEQLSSIISSPCSRGGGGADHCIMVSTNRCVAEMALLSVGWMPRRLFCDPKETEGPWHLAIFHEGYLGLLEKYGNRFTVLDLKSWPDVIGTFTLSSLAEGEHWLSIHGANRTLYAVKEDDAMFVWQFALPQTKLT